MVTIPAASSSMSFAPNAITDSRVGLSPQVFPQWVMTPRQKLLGYTASHIRNEIALGAQYPMTIVGNSPRNYLCVGPSFGNVMASVGSTTNPSSLSDMSILWEE